MVYYIRFCRKKQGNLKDSMVSIFKRYIALLLIFIGIVFFMEYTACVSPQNLCRLYA